MYQHAWTAAVQTPGGVPGQFVAHQALLVVLRTQQAGATGGTTAATAGGGGRSANEDSSFGTSVDQGHKTLAEMRQERQVHPNMESVFSIQTRNLFFPSKHGICERQVHPNMEPLPLSFLS